MSRPQAHPSIANPHQDQPSKPLSNQEDPDDDPSLPPQSDLRMDPPATPAGQAMGHPVLAMGMPPPVPRSGAPLAHATLAVSAEAPASPAPQLPTGGLSPPSQPLTGGLPPPPRYYDAIEGELGGTAFEVSPNPIGPSGESPNTLTDPALPYLDPNADPAVNGQGGAQDGQGQGGDTQGVKVRDGLSTQPYPTRYIPSPPALTLTLTLTLPLTLTLTLTLPLL